MIDKHKAKFKALQTAFMAKLDSRLEAIQSVARQFESDSNMDVLIELYRQAHSLNGAASTYGMMSISHAAKKLELKLDEYLESNSVPTQTEWDVITKTIKSLNDLAMTAKNIDPTNLLPPPKYLNNHSSPLVHIVEDDIEQTEHLSNFLQQVGYRTEVFHTPQEFSTRLGKLEKEAPAVIIMDLVFPKDKSAGISLIADLGVNVQVDIPVMVLSIRNDLNSRLQAFRAGATRYLLKPYDEEHLLSVLDSLSGRVPEDPYRVLIVDDDEDMLVAEKEILSAAGMNVRALSNPMKTLEVLEEFAPDVIVLDVYMPDATGPELAAVIREQDAHLMTPILFLSSETNMDRQVHALSLGGDDFLVKPLDAEHFIAAVLARARRARHSKTVNQRLETNLYEREREHRALDRHAIVSVTDPHGTILRVNEMFCAISGYDREEVIGKNHRLLKSGVHSPEFYRELWQTISSGRTWRGEICNRRKDGSFYWVYSTITPFLDSDGKPYQYVSIRTDVTQVKQQQLELQSIEQNLTATLESTRDGILVVSAEGKVSLANQQFYEMWQIPETMQQPGQSDAEILKHVCQQVVDPEAFLEDVEATYQSDAKSQGILEFNDGRVFERYSRPLILNDESTGRVWGFRDITRQVQADREAEHFKERLRMGQIYANIGTWEWNIPTGDLFWSERIGPLFGYAEQEIETSYENFISAVHPDDREKVSEAVRLTIEDDQPYEIEHRVVWQDGTIRWLFEKGAVSRDEQGNPLTMLGVVQDITDRKIAEITTVRSEQQLKEAQALAHIGNWQLDSNDGQVSWSDEAFHIYGYEPNELTPTKEVFHDLIHPDDKELVLTSEAIANDTGHFEAVHRIIRPDGTLRYVQQLGKVVRNSSGKPKAFSGTVQDITDKIETQRELIAAKEEAERANQAKSEFLSSMSHELRTPMNVIIGFSQLMEQSANLDDKHRNNVGMIRKAGDHLLKLINEILDLAKVESGEFEMSVEPVDVCDVVKESLDMVSMLAEQKNIEIIIKQDSRIAVQADRNRLKQALLNLLSNGIKYNNEGGSIEIDCQPSNNDMVQISIKDTGVGIPSEKLNDLFKPFNRLGHENSVIEGTGIGLTLTQRIVELMGGKVTVTSELGVGSTFCIELAKSTIAPANVNSNHLGRHAGKEPQEQLENKTSVLYIEDNPLNVALVQELIDRRDGVYLTTTHTPSLGIQLALTDRPKLILLDINLPGMDGYKVLKEIRKDERLKTIPVIAVTANAMPKDLERGKKAGFDDYLTKPLDIIYFDLVLDRYLNK